MGQLVVGAVSVGAPGPDRFISIGSLPSKQFLARASRWTGQVLERRLGMCFGALGLKLIGEGLCRLPQFSFTGLVQLKAAVHQMLLLRSFPLASCI